MTPILIVRSSVSQRQFPAVRFEFQLQRFPFSARRAIAPLTLSVAYTYSHSIDNASDGAH